MKKRTVITTEKREFWFIRSELEWDQVSDDQSVQPQGHEKRLMALLDQPREAADSNNNEKQEIIEREVDHVS